MYLQKFSRAIVLGTWMSAIIGCAQLSAPAGESAASVPGTQSWWKANQHLAEFVPGHGNAVPGVPGYFDDQGRPLDAEAKQVGYQADVGEDESQANWLENLDPGVAYQKVKDQLGSGVNVERARQRYFAGIDEFKQKKFDQALEAFADAATFGKGSSVEEDAMFMTAESHFFSDRYPQANQAYSALIQKYSNSKYLDKAIQRQFAIGQYWLQHDQADPSWPVTPNLTDKSRHRFDTRGHALLVFNQIRLTDPTGPLADDALMAIANANFLAGRYEDADYHYIQLRKDYPNSEHQYEAHLLGLQCKLKKYQGPDYDGTPLKEAEELSEQLLSQFPDKIRQDKERVVKARAEVAALASLRDWQLAQYYEGRKSYGAARYYLNQIVEKYPTTHIAKLSRERLASFEGQPDVPAQKLAWLVSLFPGKEDPLKQNQRGPVGVAWLKDRVLGSSSSSETPATPEGSSTIRR